MSYRIGFLHNRTEEWEEQAFRSLAIASQRLGHDLVQVVNSDQILEAELDFVLAASAEQAKTTPVPTFAIVDEPRTKFCDSQACFDNLASYDGYLTISDSLRRFLAAFCAGLGRPARIGAFAKAPQRQVLDTDIESLAAAGALRLCHVDSGRDPRGKAILRRLASRPWLRIYGPAEAWHEVEGGAYCGAVPLDGRAAQRVYASFGAGLATVPPHRALDGLPPRSLFEITSVGAAAIGPDLPWIREHYGDSVLYYDPLADRDEVVRQIDAAMAEIRTAPGRAAERARHARRIFERRFAAEILLAEAVGYFEEWREGPGKPSERAEDPLIDVILRAGGNETALRRTIDSIEAQLAGRFRLVILRRAPADLSRLIGRNWARIDGCETVTLRDSTPGAPVAAALDRIKGDYFTLLDEGDLWFPEHVAGLLQAVRRCPPGTAFAFSGRVALDEPPPGEAANRRERRRLASMLPPSGDIGQILESLSPGCWLASARLLRSLDPNTLMDGDAQLTGALVAAGTPVFSHRATVCSPGGNDRTTDIFAAIAALQDDIDRIEAKFPDAAASGRRRLQTALQAELRGRTRGRPACARIVALDAEVPAVSLHDRDDVACREIPLDGPRIILAGASHLLEPPAGSGIAILPPSEPGAPGMVVELDPEDLRFSAHWAVFEFAPIEEALAVTLRNGRTDGFPTAIEIPVCGTPVEAWVPLDDVREGSRVVIHNPAQPARTPSVLRRARLVRPSQGVPAHHHPVFASFPFYRGPIAPGESQDWSGARFKSCWDGQPDPRPAVRYRAGPPGINEEYFECADLLEAILATTDRFVMLEAGAGFGRWAMRGAVAARRLGRKPMVHLIEAEPQHAAWARAAIALNGVADDARVIEAAIAYSAEPMPFTITYPERDATNWYGQALGWENAIEETRETYFGRKVYGGAIGYRYVYVETTTLERAAAGLDAIDFLDMDVQGIEREIIPNEIDFLNRAVKRVHIGTHSHEAEDILRDVFRQHGWRCVWDFACLQRQPTPYGEVEFGDGVSAWINPRLVPD